MTPDDLTYWHEFLKSKDPNMSKALGPNIDIERMKAGECFGMITLLFYLNDLGEGNGSSVYLLVCLGCII